jgi:NAD(P)-dependent dehydrogenase (short-subunit alcohol dehydrogenase family)/3-oxoacyl-(acyl-carrier-protein) synthase
MNSFDNKIALVTGGARGVGAAIVTRLAERGATVIINCFHSYAAGKELQALLAGQGHAIDVIRASVAQRNQLDAMFATIGERYDGLDMVVNNAATGTFGSVLETTEENLDKAFDTNLKGALWCAQLAHPLLARRGEGAIVNLSSIGASSSVGSYVTVGTSKAALEALTRYLAVEFAPDGIRVNTASGGLIEGEVVELFPHAAEMRELVARSTPLGGIGRPEDLADVVMFLLSDAARWMTGQTLVADGGLSLGAALLTPPSAWRQRDLTMKTGIGAESGAGAPHASGTQLAPEVTEPQATGPQVTPAKDTEAADDAVICVVGMGLVLPGANNVQEFWRLLNDGPELLTVGHPDRLSVDVFQDDDPAAEDKTYQTRSGWMHSFVPHDWLAAELGDDPRRTDYTTQWFRHALSDALRGVTLPEAHRTSCVMGYTPDGNQHLEEASVIEDILDDLAHVSENLGWAQDRRERLAQSARAALEAHYPNRAPLHTLLPFQVGAGAIAGLLPDGTQLTTVDTACSSAMYAVDIGIKDLLEGKRDVAVCGGSFAVGPRNAVLFAKLHGLSTSGELRPLDERADGVLFSDGAAVVVLKRLRDASRDGDRVLGYIAGIGTSSDGRGKAIYAPNVKGQRLAIQRTAEKDPRASQPDWIVAHATGTPAGDLSEITSIREVLDRSAPVQVTSNKALIGHTGWAAGVVSLIQILLSFQHETILRQHRFKVAPAAFGFSECSLRVPTADLPWPRSERRRVASISGFGFGGTNAHMVVHDRPVAHTLPKADDIVITGWSGHVPGLSGDGVRAWLAGTSPGPELSFGPAYDASDMKLRMPPKVVRTVDRVQLMALRCADELRSGLGDTWTRYAATTGVFVGHMGPTRNAVQYAKRTHFDNVGRALRALPGDIAYDDTLREALREVVRAAVPESNEDSFPGIMPNVISARVSNYFGLNGPNMAVDMGFGSALGACQVAAAYLRAGDVDLALVGGASGNTTAMMYRLVTALTGGDVRLAEGIFMFALTRQSVARDAGMPVLATLGELTVGEPADVRLPRFGSGTAPGRVAGPLYLGADAALALVRALHADGPECAVVARDGRTSPSLSLTLRLPTASRPSPRVSGQAPEPVTEPASDRQSERLVLRHVTHWQPTSLDRVREAAVPFPRDSVVITATPELIGDLGTRPDDPLVVSVVPTSGVRRRYLAEVSAEAMTAALDDELGRVRHVRVVSDLVAIAEPADALDVDPTTAFRLQDAFFLALQACDPAIRAHHGSVLALFTSAWAGGVLHPYAGLFKGVLKSAYLELAGHQVAGVFTAQRRLAPALDELVMESAATPLLAGAVYEGGIRHTMVATAEPAEQGTVPPLQPDSVVVAVGGARGIATEVLKDVARRFQPTIIALGSRPIDELAAELERRGGRQALGSRAEFVRAELVQSRGRAVREINQNYELLTSAADTLDLLAEMERECGQGRVRYLQGDVFDQGQLDRAFAEILHTHGKIDLLIHAAGVNRAGAIATKPLAHFQEVRDIKAGGYLRIRCALAGYQPRLWCGFGSVIGFTGQVGEPDYAGANDFLTTAATYQRQVRNIDEFVISWTMWRETGMAANPIYLNFFTDGQQADTFTQMSTAEGVGHFGAELGASNRAAASVHLGQVERRKIEAAVPGFFAPRRAPANGAVQPAGTAGTDRGRFYIDRVVSEGDDRIVAERLFTADRDDYLTHHTVRGVPTLPGCFVTELAAEAAIALVPELVVTGFRDITLEHFLKLGSATERSPRRIEARLRRRTATTAVIAVRVLGDVVSPAGLVLVRDRVHFTATVVMARDYPPAPIPEPWPDAQEMPIADPYHVAGASVLLTGPFVSTTRTRVHPLGKMADYAKPAGPGTVFDQFCVPVLLLDGMARLAILELVQGRYIPTAAPTGIRRIDLYTPDNDADLAARPGPLALTVAPRGVLLDGETHDSRFYAIRPDGRAVLRMLDVSGFALSYLDTATGGHVDLAAVDAGLASFAPATEDAVPL